MRPCLALCKNGEACPNAAGESGFCFSHDPARAAERAAARRLGGLNRRAGHGGGDPGKVPAEIRNIAGVLSLLDYTFAETIVLENSVARGRLLVAMAAAYTDALKTSELENRIAILEEKVYGKS